MDNDMINGIRATAPIFHHATFDELSEVVALLSKASYHFSDDSAKEWGAAKKAVRDAAKICASFELGLSALQHIHKHTSQLVAFEQFIDAVMRARYERGVKDGYNERENENDQ
jgi:hypothetical protein